MEGGSPEDEVRSDGTSRGWLEAGGDAIGAEAGGEVVLGAFAVHPVLQGLEVELDVFSANGEGKAQAIELWAGGAAEDAFGV